MTDFDSTGLAGSLEQLAPKSRVHEVAKRFGVASRLLIDTLAEQGVVLKSSSSSVDANAAAAALTTLFERGQLTPPAVPASVAEPVTSSEPVEVAAPKSIPEAVEPPAPAPGPAAPEPEPAATAPAADEVDPYADLPARLRVHELAKRAGLTAKAMIALLTDRGIAAKSANSVIGKAVATDVLGSLTDSAGTTAEAPQQGLFLEAAGTAAPAAQDTDSADATDESADSAEEERRKRRRRGRRGRSRQGDRPQDQDSDAPEADTEDDADDASEPIPGLGAGVESGTADTGESDADEAADTDEKDTDEAETDEADTDEADTDDEQAADAAPARGGRRRRRRGGRGPDRPAADAAPLAEPASEQTDAVDPAGEPVSDSSDTEQAESDEDGDDDGTEESRAATSRRRRRRRRGVSDESGRPDDPADTVVHVREVREPREPRSAESQVQGVRGSTRLEAKRQRRRDSLQTRRRPQILTEAEFLARREAVHRVMAVRQRGDLTQVAVLEDAVLVEHFVSRAGSASMIGNVYLGRVQNVLPSMEAAFVDIGRGRNAVLYAGEVNWEAAGLAGKSRKIETALSSGDTVLVQVSKDPVGHKGARLTTQISLPGRFLVYVPAGGATGISRKLPDTERKRLKAILDRIVPDDAGVIIRTAAEGVSEEELARDVERLQAQWEQISEQAKKLSGSGNTKQLYSEPDTLIKVIRDLFNSDISELIIDGDDTSETGVWESLSSYVEQVAPELAPRVHKYTGVTDVFAAHRIDEQIAKALERKVYLPSGGSLVIDRTEAMTVIDVNTGKYTGSGGNLEETVTKNNLEAAEEVVRQLRLRDIGGIIVVDFIDMVLESNRELVLRRLTECLGRDRTRHQVAEVTSLGLVQMTRKKMGTGLVEAFSEPCEHCHGRGIVLRDVPVDPGVIEASFDAGSNDRSNRRSRGQRRDPVEVDVLPVVAPLPQVPALRRDPRGPKRPDFVPGTRTEVTAEPAPVAELAQELIAELNGLAPDAVGAAEPVTAADVEAVDVSALESLLPDSSNEAPDNGDAEHNGPRRRRRGGRGKNRRDNRDNGGALDLATANQPADDDELTLENPQVSDLELDEPELDEPELELAADQVSADGGDQVVEPDPEPISADLFESASEQEPAAEPAPEPVTESAPEAAEEPAPVAAAPRRRRSASRPAGPPQAADQSASLL